MGYKLVIGLEIHAELKTQTKMFCSSKNDSLETRPNVNVCPVCLGHPGTLPVINKEAVLKVIKTGLALNCRVQEETFFERKNYFYPDLPKGYQISQYKLPICKDGYLAIITESGEQKIRIQRVHLEEDTAKLIHSEDEEISLVDFNRAGIPLMELVTQPDIHSAKEAVNFARELQLILRYLKVSDADMEKGQMRVEVNVSLTPYKQKNNKLGTKVEIKNLNSFLAVEKSILYETKRQEEILERGDKVVQETRGWDDNRLETNSQRIKEKSQDYRYFPEPDLSPLQLEKFTKDIKKTMPELPQQKRDRFKKEYQLSGQEIEILIKNRDASNYFEKVVSELDDWRKSEKLQESQLPNLVKLAVNNLETNLMGLMKDRQILFSKLKITPENFAELVILIWKKEVSTMAGKIILKDIFESGADPTYVIKEKNLGQVSDEDEIRKIVKRVIKENPRAVEDYKNGKKNTVQFLIGGVMRKTKGKMDPKITQKIIQETLTDLSEEL
ncbi:MAG: Asp-tRNA(Asn)/Glu-tRNA(Gln) amidotransferase subunit GatB [Patescibacteria group bacterium]